MPQAVTQSVCFVTLVYCYNNDKLLYHDNSISKLGLMPQRGFIVLHDLYNEQHCVIY